VVANAVRGLEATFFLAMFSYIIFVLGLGVSKVHFPIITSHKIQIISASWVGYGVKRIFGHITDWPRWQASH
jgi:hypothetical protein